MGMDFYDKEWENFKKEGRDKLDGSSSSDKDLRPPSDAGSAPKDAESSSGSEDAESGSGPEDSESRRAECPKTPQLRCLPEAPPANHSPIKKEIHPGQCINIADSEIGTDYAESSSNYFSEAISRYAPTSPSSPTDYSSSKSPRSGIISPCNDNRRIQLRWNVPKK